MKKWILRIMAILLVLIISGIAYLKFALPNVKAPENLKITATPEMIKRGEYLANYVTMCVDCHSTRDWSKFSGPLIESTIGKGGEAFLHEYGFPGNFYSKNLTPFNLKNWTDGELLRAISCGVDKDGNAFFPVMPYPNYSKMDKDDIIAIIAYLRTLPSIENTTKESKADFPVNLILNTMPKDATFSERPSKDNFVRYGEYMTNAASCIECHTNAVRGEKIKGMEFGGGREFTFPGNKKIVSSNITPDKETGIGYWTEDMFVAKFKLYADKSKLQDYKSPKDFQTIMPWSQYAGMDTVDLKAIYAYLQSIKPIKNKVISNPEN
ncbi:MAG TPA: cytochrome C [Chitinophagales bacterium]|nr:cytochrome C [Chitinophagales bacterium]